MTATSRVHARDIARYCWLRATDGVTRLIPDTAQMGTARRIAALPARLRQRAQVQRIAAQFPHGFASHHPVDTLPRLIYAHRQEEAMMISRLARRPDWRPPLTVTGLDQLHDALADTGVMLWCCPLRFNMLLTSLALHDVGLMPIRLSHWAHGPAATQTPSHFARTRINAPWQNVENRYATRLEIGASGLRASMAEFARHLREGRSVLVNAIPQSQGLTSCDVPGGVMKLATGAARIALRSGATIMAVTVARDLHGRFELALLPLATAQAPLDITDLTHRMAQISYRAIAAAPDLWIIASPQLSPSGV